MLQNVGGSHDPARIDVTFLEEAVADNQALTKVGQVTCNQVLPFLLSAQEKPGLIHPGFDIILI